MDSEKIKRAAEINAKSVGKISKSELAEFGEIWNGLVNESGALEAHKIISNATLEIQKESEK